jgi:hypothetical protein
LRSRARASRRALPEVASEVLESSEKLNFYKKMEPATKPGK